MIDPMKVGDARFLIERAHREMSPLQWVRETAKNANEAGATKLIYGTEMQALEKRKVYRRLIADNGRGMSPGELVAFMNKFGGGGKPIGGEHENFGIGAKCGLLPWNRYGVIVLSCQDGELALVHLHFDEKSEQYGLKLFSVSDNGNGDVLSSVLMYSGDGPLELPEEPGIDWSQVPPQWARKNGTTLVLLGNSANDNTVLGNPLYKLEAETKALTKYLNSRFLEPPVPETTVSEYRATDREQWPRSRAEATQTAIGRKPNNRRFENRRIKGARAFFTDPKSNKPVASGTMIVHHAKIDWYLCEEPHDLHQLSEARGYIATEYRGELYGLSRNPSRTRLFGLSMPEIQRHTWLIIHPDEYDPKAGRGIYPRSDRSELQIHGGTEPGQALPYGQWGEEFMNSMPEEIAEALRKAFTYDPGTITDQKWKERLKERFGSRWRMIAKMIVLHKDGTIPFDETDAISIQSSRSRGGGGDSTERITKPIGVKVPSSALLGKEMNVAGGLPDYLPLPKEQFANEAEPLRELRIFAEWHGQGDPNPETYPNGVVWLNRDHPVIQEQIRCFTEAYKHALLPPEEIEKAVREAVVSVYGENIVAHVAHLLRSRTRLKLTPNDTDAMLSDHALTFALFGLMAEDQMIATRLGSLGVKMPKRAAS